MRLIKNIVDGLKKHKTKTWKGRSEKDIDKVIFHHVAGEMSVFDIAKYHVGPCHISNTGCPGICYHFFIDKDGTIFKCNTLGKVVWGVKNENMSSIHVCLNGNLAETNPTLEQIKSMIDIWEYLKLKFKLRDEDCYGHSYFGKPLCPGPLIDGIILSIRGFKKRKHSKKSFLIISTKDKQFALNKLGYYKDKIDGLWGPNSKFALYKFQKENMKTCSGIFDKETKKAVIIAMNQKFPSFRN